MIIVPVLWVMCFLMCRIAKVSKKNTFLTDRNRMHYSWGKRSPCLDLVQWPLNFAITCNRVAHIMPITCYCPCLLNQEFVIHTQSLSHRYCCYLHRLATYLLPLSLWLFIYTTLCTWSIVMLLSFVSCNNSYQCGNVHPLILGLIVEDKPGKLSPTK